MTIKELQQALNKLGANPKLVEDGIYGMKTLAAIKQFQKDNNLVADGIVGAKTTIKIFEKLAMEIRDKNSQKLIETLHPKLRDEVKNLIIEAESKLANNILVRITSGYRDFDEQNALYTLGRTKVNPDGKTVSKPMGNIVTNAKGGQSMHNFAIAFDFVLIYDKAAKWTVNNDWMIVVNTFKKAGWEWGGDWKGSLYDSPHLQKTFGKGGSYQPFLDMYNAKKFIAGTKYLNL
jgi:peptidoglycan L-alanyl-D-glutamate endopeptidase CwlK